MDFIYKISVNLLYIKKLNNKTVHKKMNKQNKQMKQNYYTKLQSCTDQLSMLLDLIYKFPQQQRQRFYDRIQLLKQNLTQLKICAKDIQNQNNMQMLEKKYQQIFIKITQLKAEINSYQYGMPNRKKKSNVNDTSSILFDREHSQGHGQKFGNKDNLNISKLGGIKSQYDSIMETIVLKEEQNKKYKQQLEQLRHVLKVYENKQNQSKMTNQNLHKQLQQFHIQIQQLHKLNMITQHKNQTLEKQLQQISNKYYTIQSKFTTQRQISQHSQLEILKLTKLLNETMDNLRMKKSQADGSSIQLAALEEKYRYDLKEYMEKQQMYRIKERSHEKQIRDMEREIEILADAEMKNNQMAALNSRFKQDIKVLQSELKIKEEQLYDKTRKIQSNRSQLTLLKKQNEDRQKDIQVRETQIQELLCIQKQNQDIILILQKKVHQMQKYIAQFDQNRLISDRKVRDYEKLVNDLQKKLLSNEQEFVNKVLAIQEDRRIQISFRDEQIKKLTSRINELEQNINILTQQKQRMQSQLEKTSLETNKADKKLQEVHKIVKKVQQQKLQFKSQFQNLQTDMKNKQQILKKDQKQIQSLRKRLLRAKIQCIHNIRQVIV